MEGFEKKFSFIWTWCNLSCFTPIMVNAQIYCTELSGRHQNIVKAISYFRHICAFRIIEKEIYVSFEVMGEWTKMAVQRLQ